MTIFDFIEAILLASERLVDPVQDGLQDGGVVEARRTHRTIAQGWRARAQREGCLSWRDIIEQHTAQVLAEDDPATLKQELIDLSAMVVRWLRDLDERTTKVPTMVGGIEIEELKMIRTRRETLASGQQAIVFRLASLPVSMAPLVARRMALKILELTTQEDVG